MKYKISLTNWIWPGKII